MNDSSLPRYEPTPAVGLSQIATYSVTADMSPPHLEGVLSTPRLVGLVEDTCLDALKPHLVDGTTSVGTEIHLHHVGTARAGDEVEVDVRLIKVTGRRLLRFMVEVRGPEGVVGSGSHQRLIVDRSLFELEKPRAGASRAAED